MEGLPAVALTVQYGSSTSTRMPCSTLCLAQHRLGLIFCKLESKDKRCNFDLCDSTDWKVFVQAELHYCAPRPGP